MTSLPPEARDGAMRAWLSILHDRNPNVIWLPLEHRHDAQVIPFPADQSAEADDDLAQAA